MGKRWYMGPTPVGDNVNTFNLDLGFVGGPATIFRRDENGNPTSGATNSASIFGRTYIVDSPENRAKLVGVDGNDELIGTGGDDLIVWETRRTGIGFPEWTLLPAGGAAAVDNFLLGAGNDLIDLTYTRDNNPATPDIPYTANANIDGGTGDDIIWSGMGNDVLSGGGGSSEIIYGSGGNDQIIGSINAFNNLSGDSGNDEIYGGNSNDGIGGGEDDDTAFGGGGIDFVDGEAGNDTVFGGAQNDNVFGGAGDDRVFGDQNDDNVDGGTGYLETLYGGTGNDHITDPDGAKFVYGEANNDRLEIGYDAAWNQGVPTLFGGSGSDTITFTGALNATFTIAINGDEASGVGDAADTVFARGSYGIAITTLGGGDDRYSYIGFANSNGTRLDTVHGGAGSDVLETGIGDDVLFGDAGNDTLQGGAGADSLYGGSEIDSISYELSGVGVTMGLTGVAGVGGDAQGDVAWTDVENLTGSSTQNDSLYGNASVNTILGLGGNDTIEGLGGGDSLDGGTGVNWLSYANSPAGLGNAGVNVDLGTGIGTGGDAQGDVIANFQNLIGSAFNDVLAGGPLDNIIDGGAGADSLSGNAGADTIFGGTGADTIGGGSGGDTLYGGALLEGNWLTYATSPAGTGGIGVTVNIGNNNVSGAGTHAEGDVIANFDNLIGTAQADSLTGNLSSNIIIGGLGVDTIRGGDGADTLAGGTAVGAAGENDWLSYELSSGGVTVDIGANSASGGHAAGDAISGFAHLIGSGLNDSLTGSSGANTIFGGAGVDTIQGGLGNDRLIGTAVLGGANEGDWLSYAASGTTVNVSLNSGTANGGAGTDTLSGFQHVLGGSAGDFLEGNDELDNSLVGNSGDDTLSGLGGIDTLFGGIGDDQLLIGNNGGTFVNTTINGWDGETGSSAIGVTVLADAARVGDYAFGGDGVDTLDMAQLTSGARRTVYSRFNADGTPSTNSNISSFIAGIEIIVAGASADIVNLTFNDGVTRSAYGESVSIFAGDGADIVFSGSGDDVIVGGVRTGSGAANTNDAGDTLYGGQGRDTIFGDDFNAASTVGDRDFIFGGGGNDTINAGVGNDTVYGGSGQDQITGNAGDDFLWDIDSGALNGDEGSDTIVIQSTSGTSNFSVTGGKDDLSADSGDRVFAGGTYGSVTASLGAGNDLYISSNTANFNPLQQIDRVFGEGQNDVISTWYGNDTIDGGSGNDALWGGAGVDTVMGNADGDIIYGGADDDLLIGGDGDDYYYFARTDGRDLISDQDPTSPDANNYLVVIPDFDPATDDMRVGSGVFETDHDLYDNVGGDDMVQVENIGGSMHRLTILSGPGAGSAVEFDANEVSVIGLWNNDATGGTPVVTAYYWDPIDGRYEYQA